VNYKNKKEKKYENKSVSVHNYFFLAFSPINRFYVRTINVTYNSLIISQIYHFYIIPTRCKITTIKRLLPAFITDFINI